MDVTVQREGVEVKAPARAFLPNFKGHQKEDNSGLYESLRRSYLRMGKDREEDDPLAVQRRDISPVE